MTELPKDPFEALAGITLWEPEEEDPMDEMGPCGTCPACRARQAPAPNLVAADLQRQHMIIQEEYALETYNVTIHPKRGDDGYEDWFCHVLREAGETHTMLGGKVVAL